MDGQKADKSIDSNLFGSDETIVVHLRRQLLLLIRKQVVESGLDISSVYILSLRMGLTDGACYSLKEVSRQVHLSPEMVRQRQYLAMKRCTGQPIFVQALRDYARLVKLPRGVTYYLHQYSDPDDQLS